MKFADDVKRFFHKATISTNPQMDEKVLKKVLIAQEKAIGEKTFGGIDWTIFMTRPTIKIAMVAIVVILAVFVLNHFNETSSIAWGNVLEKVEKIKTVTYRMQMKMKSIANIPDKNMDMVMKVYQSAEYGMRVDGFMGDKIISQSYVIPAEQSIVTVLSMQKKFMKMRLTDDMYQKIKQKSGDPKQMIEEFMKNKYTELEPNTIDGRKVRGIESHDLKMGGGMFGKVMSRIWVDVETQLPVRMEIEYSVADGQMEMKGAMDEFEWGAELDKGIFEPNIPSDYSLMADVKMPNMKDINTFTDGMRLVSTWSGGTYPSTMSIMAGMKDAVEALKEYRDPNQGEEPSKYEMESIMKVQMAYKFYAELVKADKDPCYYGKKVTAFDPQAVLLRWKVDDVNYMVIFGDLSSEAMSKEKMAEIEAKNPKEITHDIKPPRPVSDFIGEQFDKWYLDEAGNITVHNSLILKGIPEKSAILKACLPYEDGKLQSVKCDEIELQYDNKGGGKYEFILPAELRPLKNKTIEVVWSIPLSKLGTDENGFKAELRGLIMVYHYSLEFILEENCGYENTGDAKRRSFYPFSWSHGKAQQNLGSCGVAIRKSK